MNQNTIESALDMITREAATDVCINHVDTPNAPAVLRLVHALRAAMKGELDGIIIAKIAEAIQTSTADQIVGGVIERVVADNVQALVEYSRNEGAY